jgi:hypothetical protein
MQSTKASNFMAHEPCVACGTEGDGLVCYHHIYTRKAYPEATHKPWNQIPVCLLHHNLFHTKGTSHMASEFSSVKEWLENHGWEYDQFFTRWGREKL